MAVSDLDELTTEIVAEVMAGKSGPMITVDLIELNGKPDRYEVRGPRFCARVPYCPCELPVCVPGWGKSCRQRHQACHGSPWSGHHEDHVRDLAAQIAKTYTSRSRGRSGSIGVPSRRLPARAFAAIDGQEDVRLRPVMQRSYRVTAYEVVCDSPRCYVPRNESPYREPIATIRPQRYDSDLALSEAEQQAYDARNEHIAWHRSTHSGSGRHALSEWIARNAHVEAEEAGA